MQKYKIKAVAFQSLSLDQRYQMISKAFYEVFGGNGALDGDNPVSEYSYTIEDVYDDKLVVGDWPTSKIWEVSYSVADGAISFADKADWTQVARTYQAIKAVGDWELDVLAAPYGGPHNGRDSDGEAFTPATKFFEDKWPLPPVLYYHGLDDDKTPTGNPEFIGKAVKRWVDNAGVWFRVVLDKSNEFAQRVWDAAKAGTARASSGSINYLARRTADGKILEWPIAEISLFDTTETRRPANAYAVALPAAKAIFDRAGMSLPDDIASNSPQVEAKAAPSAPSTESGDISSYSAGESDMDSEELKKIIAEAMKANTPTPVAEDPEVKALKAQLDEATKSLASVQDELKTLKGEEPKFNDKGDPIKITRDEADNGFGSLGEQLVAVANAAIKGQVDRRLLAINEKAFKASGMNESVPSEGGFAVQTDLVTNMLEKVWADGEILSRLGPSLPLSTNANSTEIPYVKEEDRGDGYRWGGIQAYWAHEAATVTASKFSIGKLRLELNKLFALMYITDELIADAPQLQAYAERTVPRELRFKFENAIVNGTGAGEPLGILNADCLVAVTIEDGQAADTVVKENVDKMWSRLWGPSRPYAAWFISQDIEPQLDNMVQVVGTGGVPVYLPPGGLSESPYARLKGRPVIPIEYCPTLGDEGDINLWDLREYLTIRKEMQSASSIHVKFIYDEMTFRWTWRVDGEPAWPAPLTPYNDGNTLSPFVTLAERA